LLKSAIYNVSIPVQCRRVAYSVDEALRSGLSDHSIDALGLFCIYAS